MDSLLERDDELAALREIVDGALGGRGRIVLLGGEAGIGKTSLVRALRALAPTGVAFLAGACEPLSVPVPLAPLRELADAAGFPLQDAGDRLVLARALLGALTERAPAVAVIEDAHWADPATVDVVRLLARRLEDTRIALLVTYRDDELTANPDLARLVGDLATAPFATRIVLRALSERAVRELAEPAGLDGAQLARVTGGNPFLVVETIAAGERFPESVRDATLARAGRLGAGARAVVDAAAVIGARVAPDLLEEVVPGSAADVEEAIARGVLVGDGPALGFRHELIREAIEASISPSRHATLSARVVAALERAGADSARLAHHAERAGMRSQACAYATAAATEAERVGALREVSLQAERALRLDAGHDAVARFELLVQHSRASNFASVRLEDAVSSAQEAIRLADVLGDPVRGGRALLALASALWSLDRVDGARDAALEAVQALERTDDIGMLARAHAAHMRIEATALDPAVAIATGPRALDLAERAGLAETRIDVAISLGLARGHHGDAAGLAMLEDANRAALAAGLPFQTVRSYVNRTFVAALLRRHAQVDAAAAAALPLFEEIGTAIPAYAVELFRARSLLDRGCWDDALAIANETGHGWAGETPVAWTVQGLVAVRRGEISGAERLRDAWIQIANVPEGSRHGTVRVALIEAAWLRGDRAAALEQLRRARDSPASTRFARSGAELALWGRRLGLALDAPPGAPEPVALELAGEWRAAIRAWRALEAPYEAALAALGGDERAARDALAGLHALGATGAARAFVRDRASLGAPAPRGPRRTTLANAAGLTRREQEVLDRLATGATNVQIAAALHLSERTVAHHVSAVLRKLDAPNRVAAIDRARTRGLLAQDGPPRDPT